MLLGVQKPLPDPAIQLLGEVHIQMASTGNHQQRVIGHGWTVGPKGNEAPVLQVKAFSGLAPHLFFLAFLSSR